jgi:hypothetical protein
MMLSSSIHLPVNDEISFFVAEEYSIVCVCVCHILLIHSSTVGHLGCFHRLEEGTFLGSGTKADTLGQETR